MYLVIHSFELTTVTTSAAVVKRCFVEIEKKTLSSKICPNIYLGEINFVHERIWNEWKNNLIFYHDSLHNSKHHLSIVCPFCSLRFLLFSFNSFILHSSVSSHVLMCLFFSCIALTKFSAFPPSSSHIIITL